jgi:hypothetical protein
MGDSKKEMAFGDRSSGGGRGGPGGDRGRGGREERGGGDMDRGGGRGFDLALARLTLDRAVGTFGK